MNNLKANRVIALKQVGINKKEVEDYRKSSREYFVQYRGREGKYTGIVIKSRNSCGCTQKYGSRDCWCAF